mmetsp:Transcript_46005/g.67888  ORF Transcript_46005/g.67888 Transcript_46005/m.67888 type:complete len:80 (-) Transcript_46005:444-683(-)
MKNDTYEMKLMKKLLIKIKHAYSSIDLGSKLPDNDCGCHHRNTICKENRSHHTGGSRTAAPPIAASQVLIKKITSTTKN